MVRGGEGGPGVAVDLEGNAGRGHFVGVGCCVSGFFGTGHFFLPVWRGLVGLSSRLLLNSCGAFRWWGGVLCFGCVGCLVQVGFLCLECCLGRLDTVIVAFPHHLEEVVVRFGGAENNYGMWVGNV